MIIKNLFSSTKLLVRFIFPHFLSMLGRKKKEKNMNDVRSLIKTNRSKVSSQFAFSRGVLNNKSNEIRDRIEQTR